MNLIEKGQLIAKLRKEAGYTQKALAKALFVTDKAVSKWERGICLPDSSLLIKLSMLLDADIEYLISGNQPYGEHKWCGMIKANNLDLMVSGKPLIFYLLSYFMLVGITDIAVITSDEEYVRSLKLKQYGLHISFTPFEKRKTMIVYDRFLLFGVNITRQLQHCMSNEKDVVLTLHDREVPIVFVHQGIECNFENKKKNIEYKTLGRGTIFIPMNTDEEISDASAFVEVYEKYHKVKIADLNEIAVIRRLV